MAKKDEKGLEELAAELEAKDKTLSEAREELEKKTAALNERGALLDKRERELDARVFELEEKEAALPDKPAPMAEASSKPALSKAEIGLIEKAFDTYKIDPKHVLDVGIDRQTGAAVIITAGGAKVRYLAGDEKKEGFEPLSQVRVDGISRKKPKAVLGKKK